MNKALELNKNKLWYYLKPTKSSQRTQNIKNVKNGKLV